MKKTKIAVAVLIAAAFAGCYDRPQYAQPVAQSAPMVAAPAAAAPVIVNQAPAHSGTGDMLMGGALGYLLGRSSGGSGSGNNGGDTHRTTTVNKTVVNKTVIVQQAPRPVTPAPAPTPTFSKGYSAAYASKPSAPSRGSFGGYGGRSGRR
jgi:hypothetical protein